MDNSAPKLQQRGQIGLFFSPFSLFPARLYCKATASCSVYANKRFLCGMLTVMESTAQKQDKLKCSTMPPCSRRGRRGMRRAASCLQGFNLSLFKSLLTNPHLNVSSFGLRALCSASKSNILSECAADCPHSHFYHLDTILHS